MTEYKTLECIIYKLKMIYNLIKWRYTIIMHVVLSSHNALLYPSLQLHGYRFIHSYLQESGIL